MPEILVDPFDCTPEQRAAVIAQAFERRDLKPAEKAVLIALADPEHKFFGIYWDIDPGKAADKLVLLRVRFSEIMHLPPPRLEEIAADTGYHMPLVQGAMRRLMKAGLVVWRDRQ